MRFLILLMVFGAGSLIADPVLSFNTSTPPALPLDSLTETIGWEFNVLSGTTVTGLGWYDQGSDGLQDAHEVGIWSSSGAPVASAVVAAGTADPLVGLFRTVTIAPIPLAPGEYIVGGL